MSAADLVWTASGTATLEIGYWSPMVIIYRVAWLTYWIARLLVRVDHIGMVNLLAGKRRCRNCSKAMYGPHRLIAESRRLLTDDILRRGIVKNLPSCASGSASPAQRDRLRHLAMT